MIASGVSRNEANVEAGSSLDLSAVTLDSTAFDGDCMELAAKIWNAVISGLAAARGSDGKPIVTETWSDGVPNGGRQIIFNEEYSQLTWDPIDGYVMDGVLEGGPGRAASGHLELIAEIDRGGVVLQLVLVPEVAASDGGREEIDYGHWLLKPSDPSDVFGRKIGEAVDLVKSFLR